MKTTDSPDYKALLDQRRTFGIRLRWIWQGLAPGWTETADPFERATQRAGLSNDESRELREGAIAWSMGLKALAEEATDEHRMYFGLSSEQMTAARTRVAEYPQEFVAAGRTWAVLTHRVGPAQHTSGLHCRQSEWEIAEVLSRGTATEQSRGGPSGIA